MINFFSKPHGPRKVIDLIYHVSHGLFVNMDPTCPIQVGDYGIVNKESGRFTSHGNIYTDYDANKKYDIPHPETRDPEEKLILLSENGIRKGCKFDIETGVAGVAQFKLQLEVDFSAERSVAMAVIRPQTTEIPTPGKLAKLVANKSLLHMAVVDQVLVCPAYALIITASNGGKVDVSFGAQVPTLAGPQGAEMGGRWIISTSSGYERSASFLTAKCYVLYRLKDITRRGIKDHRSHPNHPRNLSDDDILEPDDISDDVELHPYDVPWGILDEEGDDEYTDELDEYALAEVKTFKIYDG